MADWIFDHAKRDVYRLAPAYAAEAFPLAMPSDRVCSSREWYDQAGIDYEHEHRCALSTSDGQVSSQFGPVRRRKNPRCAPSSTPTARPCLPGWQSSSSRLIVAARLAAGCSSGGPAVLRT